MIGATGCGKSTVINLIPRFYDATEGTVSVDGVNVKDYSQKELRNKIGYVSQKATLFTGTIESNVAYGDNGQKNASETDIKKLLILHRQVSLWILWRMEVRHMWHREAPTSQEDRSKGCQLPEPSPENRKF